MRQIDITVPVTEVTFEELPDNERHLVSLARQATYRSYAPYSRFHVGAAILLDNGEIVTGSNQENAAFPSGTCAERTAAYWAHSTYPGARFVTIAIAARGTNDEDVKNPISPCGACRQALIEYENLAGRPVKVILAGHDRIYILLSLSSLLPLAFTEF